MSGELFEAPFNLRGEELREEIDAEGQARVDTENNARQKRQQISIPFNPARRRPNEHGIGGPLPR